MLRVWRSLLQKRSKVAIDFLVPVEVPWKGTDLTCEASVKPQMCPSYLSPSTSQRP